MTSTAQAGLKLLYTPAAAGQVLGVSRAMVYRLIRSGELPSVKVSSSYRVHCDDLESYAQSLRDARARSKNDSGRTSYRSR